MKYGSSYDSKYEIMDGNQYDKHVDKFDDIRNRRSVVFSALTCQSRNGTFLKNNYVRKLGTMTLNGIVFQRLRNLILKLLRSF